jgi:hypothetical protein
VRWLTACPALYQGMTAAACGIRTVATDMEYVVELAQKNIDMNRWET